MKTLVVEEKENNVLVSLAILVARLPELKVTHWAFREVQFLCGRPFGLAADDVERLSRDLKGGFVVADVDFREFLQTNLQLVDGVVEAVFGNDVLVIFDCIDAGQWEISTEDDQIIEQIKHASPSL